MSTSKECKAVRNCILNELHLTKEDIIKNIEPLLEKHVKRYMVNTYGGDNQIENWIRCMVNDELKRRDHDFVRKACESVIRDHQDFMEFLRNVAADIWVEYTEPEQRGRLFNLINKKK